jgi:pyruvate dehydrogenase E1 component alpha subunit
MFRDRVVKEGKISAGELDAIDAGVKQEIAAAIEFARQSPEPELETALQDIFTE